MFSSHRSTNSTAQTDNAISNENAPVADNRAYLGNERPSFPPLYRDVHSNAGNLQESPDIMGKTAMETMRTLREFDQTYAYLCDLPNDHFNAVTVGVHSEQVMHQLLRYPFHHSLGYGEVEKVKILISCHDLEKYPLDGNRDHTNAHEEHRRAEKWLRHFAPKFGLTRGDDLELAVSIIHSEVLSYLVKEVAPARPTFEEKRDAFEAIVRASPESQGELYRLFADETYSWIQQSRVSDKKRSELIAEAVSALSLEASACGASLDRYFKYAVAFYQCDCSAYSRDCISESTGIRGPLSVEFLFEQKSDAHIHSPHPTFEFDLERGRIKMRGVFEATLSMLENTVSQESR
jgi:hypothetical protein